mgnify:FL=1
MFFKEVSACIPFSPMDLLARRLYGCGTFKMGTFPQKDITIQGCFGMGTFQHRDLMVQGPLGLTIMVGAMT